MTTSFDNIPNSKLNVLFEKFVRKLEKYTNNTNNKTPTSDSKTIIKDFLKTENCFYQGVELIMHGIVVAAVKLSVESSVESLVSRYAKHFNKSRQITESNAQEEMMISENGPNLAHADKLIKKSLDEYFKQYNKLQNGRWRLVVSNKIKSESKTVERLQTEESKLSFMQI